MAAEVTTRLMVRFAWWVRPYLALLGIVIDAVSPFVSEDDETIKQLVALHSAFICRFGMRCVVE